MSKRDYRNYRAMSGNTVDEAVPAEVKEEVTKAIGSVDETEVEIDVDESVSYIAPEEGVTEEAPADEPLIGRVSGCKRLNIRKQPNKDSEPVCVVEEGTVLMIDLQSPTKADWFKVYTETGIEGYCMRDFVKVNE